MAQFQTAGTPSAWARLSKHGGLDINSIPRDEAEDLINKIAALEDQLNESESNYERIYTEYEKAKTYYQDIEASIEAATETYLAEKGQFLAKQDSDAATIADLQSQLEEEHKAKETAQSQLSTAKAQLRQVQEDAAAAKQKLTKQLEKAEAATIAAREVARAAEERAAQRIAVTNQMEKAAKEATKAAEKQEAALRKEETKLKRALEERERKVAKREEKLGMGAIRTSQRTIAEVLVPTASPVLGDASGASPSGAGPSGAGPSGAGPSSISPGGRKILAALRAPTATKAAGTAPAATQKTTTASGFGKPAAAKKSISAALFSEPMSSNKANVSSQQPARRLAVKVARKADVTPIEEVEDEKVEDEIPGVAIATVAAVAGPSGRSVGRATTVPAAKKASTAAKKAPSVKKTTETKKKAAPKKTTSAAAAKKTEVATKATSTKKTATAPASTAAKRRPGKPTKTASEGTAAANKTTAKRSIASALDIPYLPAVDENQALTGDDAAVKPTKRSKGAAATTTPTMTPAVETTVTRSGRVSVRKKV